jgi:hypothetical protein
MSVFSSFLQLQQALQSTLLAVIKQLLAPAAVFIALLPSILILFSD